MKKSLLILVCIFASFASCKTHDSTSSVSKSDSGSVQKSNIKTNGNVKSGTFVNGASKDTSSTGSKPRN